MIALALLVWCSFTLNVHFVAKTLQFICARRNLSTPISHPNPNIFFAFLNKVQKYSVSYLFYRMQSSWINRNGKKFPSYLKLFTLFKYSYNKSFMLFWKPHFSDSEIFVKSNSFMCDLSLHHSYELIGNVFISKQIQILSWNALIDLNGTLYFTVYKDKMNLTFTK